MRVLSTLCIAGLALAAASAASAQAPAPPAPGPAAPGPTQASGGADTNATGPYAGAGPHAFYDVQGRIDHMQQSAASLPPAKGRHVVAQLKAIRADLKFRMGRHNGELRDFDRELISEKLDHLAAQYPALQN